MRTYEFLNQDVVRSKNRVKAVFRSYVATPGTEVYSPDHRDPWLARLPVAVRTSCGRLLAEMDALEELKAEALHDMVGEAKRHEIYKRLITCPGLGPVRVSKLMAVVVDSALGSALVRVLIRRRSQEPGSSS